MTVLGRRKTPATASHIVQKLAGKVNTLSVKREISYMVQEGMLTKQPISVKKTNEVGRIGYTLSK